MTSFLGSFFPRRSELPSRSLFSPQTERSSQPSLLRTSTQPGVDRTTAPGSGRPRVSDGTPIELPDISRHDLEPLHFSPNPLETGIPDDLDWEEVEMPALESPPVEKAEDVLRGSVSSEVGERAGGDSALARWREASGYGPATAPTDVDRETKRRDPDDASGDGFVMVRRPQDLHSGSDVSAPGSLRSDDQRPEEDFVDIPLGGPSEPPPPLLRDLSMRAHNSRQSARETLKIGGKMALQMMGRDMLSQAAGQSVAVLVRSGLRYAAVAMPTTGPVVAGVTAGAVVLGMSWYVGSRGADLLSQSTRALRERYDEKGPALRHMITGAAVATAFAGPAVNYLMRHSPTAAVGLLADTAGRMVGQYFRDQVSQHLTVHLGKVEPITRHGRVLDRKEQFQRLDAARLLVASAVYAGMSVGSMAGAAPRLTDQLHGDTSAADFRKLIAGIAAPAMASTLLEAFDGLTGTLAATVSVLRDDDGFRYTPMGQVEPPTPRAVKQAALDNAGMRIIMGAISDVMNTAIATVGKDDKLNARVCAGLVNGLTELRGQLVALGQRNEKLRLAADPLRQDEQLRRQTRADELAVEGVWVDGPSVGGSAVKWLATAEHARMYAGCLAYVDGKALGVIRDAGTTSILDGDSKGAGTRPSVVIDLSEPGISGRQQDHWKALEGRGDTGVALIAREGKLHAVLELGKFKVTVGTESRSRFADLRAGDAVFVQGQPARYQEWDRARNLLTVTTPAPNDSLAELAGGSGVTPVPGGQDGRAYALPTRDLYVEVPRAPGRVMAVDLNTAREGDVFQVDGRSVRFVKTLRDTESFSIIGFQGVPLVEPGDLERMPQAERFLVGEHRIEKPTGTRGLDTKK